MKIAQIAPPWLAIPPKNYGGTEAVIYHLVEEQVAQGHNVTLFAPGDAKTSAKHVSFYAQSLIEANIPWNAHLKAYYHLYKSVEAIRQEGDFDIVHTHLSSASDMYLFPLLAGLLTPYVMTLHSRFPFDRVQNWMGDADQFYMRDWGERIPMVAISESAQSEVEYSLNWAGVVHHGLPMQDYMPTNRKVGDSFVWLGRMVPDKGTHLAIEAAKRADVSLIIAGTVDRHQRESVEYFNERIKPQIDNKQIRYIGPVNMKEKVSLLSRARGFLNPIEWEEPFGMVMIESMALGCPVISFARGAASEIIVHRKSGFLVNNLEEMIAFMPRVSELNREAIRAYVERNFSVRVMVENYMKVYKKVRNMPEPQKHFILSKSINESKTAGPVESLVPAP